MSITSIIIGSGGYRITNKYLEKLIGRNATNLLMELADKSNYIITNNKDRINKHTDTSGWFYFTRDAIYEETTLSHHEQRKALSILKELRMVETTEMTSPNKTHYWLNQSVILYVLGQIELEDIKDEHSDINFSTAKIKPLDLSELYSVVKTFNNRLLKNYTTFILQRKEPISKRPIPKKEIYKEISKPPIKKSTRKNRDPIKQSISKNGIITTNDFDKFYSLYPRKMEKKRAIKEWELLCETKNPPKLKILTKAIKKQIKAGMLQKGDIYTSYPVNWLKGEGWTNEIINKQQTNKTSKSETGRYRSSEPTKVVKKVTTMKY